MRWQAKRRRRHRRSLPIQATGTVSIRADRSFTEFTFRSARSGRQAVLPYPFALAKRGLRHGEAMRRLRAARFWGKHLSRQSPEKEIGSASPTLSLLCSRWPPRPAWLHTVKSASVQSDLVLLLFLLLRGHDLVSLMNSRPKTPRLSRDPTINIW